MKKTDNSTPSPAPAAAAPAPVLDPKKNARAVTPWRHHKTARTVGWHQNAGDGAVHLFSPTCGFITTVPAAEAAANEPKPAAPASDAGDPPPPVVAETETPAV